MKTNLLAILLFILTPFFANAAVTWTGGAGATSVITIAEWNNPSNWSPANVPGLNESVTFTFPVTIVENVPLTAGNLLKVQSAVTVSVGVTLSTSDVSIEGGTLTIDGTVTSNNVAYNNSGGTINNNGTFNVNNLNVGSGTLAGTFNNNGTLNSANNLVIEEGVFDNNPGAMVNTVGITIQSGGTILNGGTIVNIANSSVGQVVINNGGTFTNESSGSLSVDLGSSSVYSIRVLGTMTNQGTTTIGTQPYDPDSEGMLVGSGGHYTNTGVLVFNIDPANCVIVDNHGASGSFSTVPIFIVTGKNCLNTILPVTLVSFNGVGIGCAATIAWETSMEIDVDRFIIEKSTDGNNFTEVAEQTPHQNPGKYSVTVDQSVNLCYYRLVTLNMDGSRKISSVVQVRTKCTGNDNAIVVYPNLASNGAIIKVKYNISASNRNAELLVTNIDGKRIDVKNVVLENGINTLNYPAYKLRAGIYYVQLKGINWTSSVEKLVIVE